MFNGIILEYILFSYSLKLQIKTYALFITERGEERGVGINHDLCRKKVRVSRGKGVSEREVGFLYSPLSYKPLLDSG